MVAFDSLDEDNKVYGIIELDTTDIDTDMEVCFFNDEGKIDLHIREVTKSEYDTYVAFELFPILVPYSKEYVPLDTSAIDRCTIDWGIDFSTPPRTVFKVRFRDY